LSKMFDEFVWSFGLGQQWHNNITKYQQLNRTTAEQKGYILVPFTTQVLSPMQVQELDTGMVETG